MGTLMYGTPPSEIHIDDRVLAHLKVVIVGKLRRSESFLVSWDMPADEGDGRMSLWMHPSIPLQFVFESRERPQLNQTWLEEMARTSVAAEGLRIGSEPGTDDDTTVSADVPVVRTL